MDAQQATADARRILGGATTALLTSEDIQAVLDRARVVPTDPGSYDPWLLAAELADLLGIRSQAGALTEVSSEGTTIKRTPADFFAMASALRAKSSAPTATAGRPRQLGVVSIGTGEGQYGYTPGLTVLAEGGYVEWDGDYPCWHAWQTPGFQR